MVGVVVVTALRHLDVIVLWNNDDGLAAVRARNDEVTLAGSTRNGQLPACAAVDHLIRNVGRR
jgi:hypothetical protein